jgi:hypothetical protein
MIIFPYLRTKRIAVELREPTIEEAIGICQIPGSRHEEATTRFLKIVASKAEVPRPGYVTDPRLWTVGERNRVVCQYLMQVADDGPDFSVGAAKMTSYAILDADFDVAPVPLGNLGDQPMVFRPMVGALAEVLELECSNIGDWHLAAMGCLIYKEGEPEPDWAQMSSSDILVWVRNRISETKARPESEFGWLYDMLETGLAASRQFFHLGFADDGIVCMPCKEEAGQHPARFRPISAISEATRSIFGEPG